jgi:hypothetical protein
MSKAKKQGTGKKKGRKGKAKSGLFGVDQPTAEKAQRVFLETLKYLGVLVGGTATGVVLGKYSLAGIPAGIIALIADKPTLAMLAFTAAAAPAIDLERQALPAVKVSETQAGVQAGTAGFEGMEGFDFKQFTDDAKARLHAYFMSLGEKLHLSPKQTTAAAAKALQTVQGLFGPDESVSYFLNPGTSGMGEVDLSALDKLQAQIAQANAANNQNLTGDQDEEDDFAGII